MSSQSCPTFNLGPFLEKEELKTYGSNFTSWFCTLRILLVPHKISYVLDAVLGDTSQAEKNVYLTKSHDSTLVQSGMLYAIEAELQKHSENLSAYEVITDLKEFLHRKPRPR